MIIDMAYHTCYYLFYVACLDLEFSVCVLIRIMKLFGLFKIFYYFIMELSILDGYWARVRVLTTNWYEPKL